MNKQVRPPPTSFSLNCEIKELKNAKYQFRAENTEFEIQKIIDI